MTEGRCYEGAAKIFFKLHNEKTKSVLVHGFITYPSGNRIGHAWVEIPSMNRVVELGTTKATMKEEMQVYPLDWFYTKSGAKIEVMEKYDDVGLVVELINKTQTWGPYKWVEYLREKKIA